MRDCVNCDTVAEAAIGVHSPLVVRACRLLITGGKPTFIEYFISFLILPIKNDPIHKVVSRMFLTALKSILVHFG